MAEKPAEEAYISVTDEEPEILQLLKWDNAPQVQKQAEQRSEEPDKPSEPEEMSTSSDLQGPNPFDLPDAVFVETYRVTKDIVYDLLEDLKATIKLKKDGSKPEILSSLETKLLGTLYFYANGRHQKVPPPKDPALSAHHLSNAVIQVTAALNHPTIVKKYIHFPHLKEEREEIKNKFYMKHGIPNVIGCVDCTHVPIAKPDGNEKNHFNKSYHSQKVQIICDSDLAILSVEPRGGAMSHDGIMNRHALKADLENLNNSGEQCWLIGSQYYSLRNYIMTPIPKITKKSPASPEKYYNTIHAQALGDVQLTIKHLKSRWKCLQATTDRRFDPANVSMIIVACCILHNICNKKGLAILQLTPAEERLEAMKQRVANVAATKKLNDTDAGKEIRKQLVERLWNERKLPENGPKKRAKKEKAEQPPPPPVQPPPQLQQMHLPTCPNHQPCPNQVQVQNQGEIEHDDPSKRPRMMNPPAYVMPHVSVWGHYPPHP